MTACWGQLPRVRGLEAVIAAKPALTSEVRRAKALHALREADPPCGGFNGFNAGAFSALWDIVQAGGAVSDRRNLLTSAAAVMLLPRAVEAGVVPHPDAELIAACRDYIRIQREFEAYYDTLPSDIEADDHGVAIIRSVDELGGKIIALRAVTAEGYAARAKCVAWHYLPNHRSCQDNPDYGFEDRFMAAGMRDLVADVRGGRA